MVGFIETDLAPAGQLESSESAPSSLRYLVEFDAVVPKGVHRLVEVVAHQVELVFGRRITRMDGDFCRRQLEDQPAVAGIDVWIRQYIPEELSIGGRICAVDDDMGSGNRHHASLAQTAEKGSQLTSAREPIRLRAPSRSRGGRQEPTKAVGLSVPEDRVAMKLYALPVGTGPIRICRWSVGCSLKS